MSSKPEPSENTQLILMYLLPFLNGILGLRPPETDKVRELVRPPYLYFFKIVFPEVQPDVPANESNSNQTVFDDFFHKAFPEHVCDRVIEDAVRLRRMIAVAANGDDGQGLNTLSYEDNWWVQENSGQINISPKDWTYNKIGKHVTPIPKKIDNLPGVYEEAWGWPQLLSLFIFWLQLSFDKDESGRELSNGEFHIGICPQCKKVLKRSDRNTKTYCGDRCRKAFNKRKSK
jgi:hypothetical protein